MLTKARRELKLKADDIATELCLSVQQVQAIENNLIVERIQCTVHTVTLKPCTTNLDDLIENHCCEVLLNNECNGTN